MSVVQAKRSYDLFNSVGVNTHYVWLTPGLSWNDTAMVQRTLAATGIKHVRDGDPYEGWTMPFYVDAAKTGVKFLILPGQDDFNNTGNFNKHIGHIVSLLNEVPGSVFASDGFNEINNWGINVAGGNTQTNLSKGRDLQIQMRNDFSNYADNRIKTLPIVNLSTASITGDQAFAAMGDLTPYCDYSAWHNYFNYGDQARNNLTFGRDSAHKLANKPTIITEWNYYTSIYDDSWAAGSGVTYNVQSKLVLNGILMAFSIGIFRTYIYELLDNNSDLNADQDIEGSLGIAEGNGTLKPSGVAIRRLLDTVVDTATNAATFAPGTLDYSLTGLPPSNAYHFLCQKADGTFQICVWSEPDIWDQSARSEISINTSNVTLTVNGKTAQTISTIAPHTGVTQTANNTNTITFPLSSHPQIVTITGVANTVVNSGPPSRINKTCALT